MKALDLLHQAMRSVLHRRTAMAIEMARDGGAFIRRRRLF
jgi:1,2-phenylacetyl-CoA epoxidase PaaB subunit